MSKQFTFRTIKATGFYRSFITDTIHVKLDGKIIGSIQERSIFENVKENEEYSIWFSIKQRGNVKSPFKNVCLKKKFPNADAAKIYLKDHAAAILKQFDLYSHSS